MVMEQISLDKAKEIAKKKGLEAVQSGRVLVSDGAWGTFLQKKGLKPGRVKGTNGIQFTKGSNARLEIVSWEDFEKTLGKRGLAVYESGGWMKIMKKAK